MAWLRMASTSAGVVSVCSVMVIVPMVLEVWASTLVFDAVTVGTCSSLVAAVMVAVVVVDWDEGDRVWNEGCAGGEGGDGVEEESVPRGASATTV